MYEELRQFIGVLVRTSETNKEKNKLANIPNKTPEQCDNPLKWLDELQSENALKQKYQNKYI
ncbi:MAG: hypothetical protein ABSA84_03420 [Gammaproteobacteria bacterium]|jgi:phage/plasmid-associated DNA primase